ncbi:MAG: LPS export ABC transporter periplasmic protein LptC [Deltaproteobacteria bacterium]|nr:LPS export ABC transporter periplasmic protein LptC [Deltaproteobacteria bacterium]
MVRKSLLALLGLGSLALAGLAWWALRPESSRRPAGPPQAGRQPTSVARGIELVDVDPDGTRWRITARKGSGWEQEGTGSLTGIEALFDKKGQAVRVKAGSAAMESGTLLTLSQGVEVSWDGYRAALDRAAYHRGQGRISSDSPVLLDGPGMTVRGKGVDVDVETRKARIRSEVRAVIQGGSH